jgi:hypothetical protein
MTQLKILSCSIVCFSQLFGWDLKSLWQTANQRQCYALFRAGSFGAAIESYQSIMDKVDEDMKAGLRAWFMCKYLAMSSRLFAYNHQSHFTQLSSEIETRCASQGDGALTASGYLYSLKQKSSGSFHLYLDSSCIA